MRYAAAVAAVVTAVLLRYLTVPVFGTGTQFLTLYPAALIVALFAGPGPAFTATVIGCLLSEWLLVPTSDPLPVLSARVGMVVLSATLVGYIGRRLRAAEVRTRSTVRRFELLARVAEQLLRAREPQLAVEQVCREAMGHLGCDVFFNFLLDDCTGRLRLNACGGVPPEKARALEWMELGETVCGCVARDAHRIVAEKIPTSPDPRTRLVASLGVKAYACHPLLGPGEEVLGTLSFGSRSREKFSAADLGLMKTVADHVAAAMVRIRSEQALRESELFHRQALESIPGMVFTTRPEGEWDYRSRQWAEFTGVPLADPLADGWSSLLHPDDRLRAQAAWQDALQAGTDYDLEYRVRRHDGSYRWFKVRGRPIRDAAGRVVRWFGICLDIEDLRRADEEVRQRAEEMVRLMEIAPAAIWVAHDPQCRTITGNRLANELYEADSRENVSATTVPQVRRFFRNGQELPPEQLPMQVAAGTNADVQTSEIEVVLRSGRRFTMLGGASPLRDAAGNVRGSVAAFIDISDRKRFEDHLRRSEQKLRLAMTAAQMGTWVYTFADQSVELDEKAQRLYGSSEPTLAHDPESVRRWMHADDIDAMWQAVEKACAPGGAGHYRVEYRVYLPDGTARWLNAWGQVEFEGTGEQRHPVRMIGASCDVSERKRAEQVIRESEDRLQMALRCGRLGSWVWVVGTEEVEWSDGHYTVLGYRVGEVEPSYQAFRCRVHPDDLDRQEAEIRESMEQRREYRCEYRIIWPDGTVHWTEARGRYIYDESGKPSRMYGVLIDIDEQRRLQDQRQSLLEAERAARMQSEQLNRLKDEFLATVSHELRSPLSAIVGWTALLSQGRTDSGKALEIISRSAASLTQIVEDLLDMSRIISGKIRLSCGPVNLFDVVHNVVEGIHFSAQAKSIDVRVLFEPDLGPIVADENRIQQVIWNLLTNAIKFTPEGGCVRLSVGRAASRVFIRVEDTGRGIAPEFLPHIFERFRQEDGSIARKHGGLGLGLSIVKPLVELHGGTVEASSGGEGQGATFTVLLPGGPDEGATAKPTSIPCRQPSTAMDESALAGVRILGVDDDPFSRDLLDRILSDAGAIVQTAEDSARAEELLAGFTPDVLISDIGMPGEDGMAFVRRLRASQAWRALPAIAVTALSRPEDHLRVEQSGFDAHVGKPFDPGTLCRVVRDVVAARSGPLPLIRTTAVDPCAPTRDPMAAVETLLSNAEPAGHDSDACHPPARDPEPAAPAPSTRIP